VSKPQLLLGLFVLVSPVAHAQPPPTAALAERVTAPTPVAAATPHLSVAQTRNSQLSALRAAESPLASRDVVAFRGLKPYGLLIAIQTRY